MINHLQKMKKKIKKLSTRDMETLIEDFKNSIGFFEEFHNSLNGEEKIMLKSYLNNMRNTNIF